MWIVLTFEVFSSLKQKEPEVTCRSKIQTHLIIHELCENILTRVKHFTNFESHTEMEYLNGLKLRQESETFLVTDF